LKISGFRGDAIFIYTPEACFVNPQSFVEMLERLYIVFADALRQMQFNTTCPCRACKNLKSLDLKMCIHYGEYMIQKLGDREELLGADVIVPHRMLKNQVIEKTGIHSYALFSEAAANALNLQQLCDPLASYKESYEHIGEVNMFVHNLKSAWEREEARKKIVVDEKYGELLGASMIGPEVTELLPELTLAHLMELTPHEIARNVHAHPTLSEVLMEAAHGAEGSPIHI
jgi:hypothetical protein